MVRAHPLVHAPARMNRPGRDHVSAIASDVETGTELLPCIVSDNLSRMFEEEMSSSAAGPNFGGVRQSPMYLFNPCKGFIPAVPWVDIEDHQIRGRAHH